MGLGVCVFFLAVGVVVVSISIEATSSRNETKLDIEGCIEGEET